MLLLLSLVILTRCFAPRAFQILRILKRRAGRSERHPHSQDRGQLQPAQRHRHREAHGEERGLRRSSRSHELGGRGLVLGSGDSNRAGRGEGTNDGSEELSSS